MITKPPFGSIHAAEALRLANGALSFGHRVMVILIGDGVYVAKGGQKAEEEGWTSLSPIIENLISSGRARTLVDQDSATERGVKLQDLPKGVEMVSTGSISSAIAGAERSTVF